MRTNKKDDIIFKIQFSRKLNPKYTETTALDKLSGIFLVVSVHLSFMLLNRLNKIV